MEEENKYQSTNIDITLQDKSQDLTDSKIKLDSNIYAGDERSNNEISPDFMIDDSMKRKEATYSSSANKAHNKSYDLIDYNKQQKESLLKNDSNLLNSAGNKLHQSATVVNKQQSSIIGKDKDKDHSYGEHSSEVQSKYKPNSKSQYNSSMKKSQNNSKYGFNNLVRACSFRTATFS